MAALFYIDLSIVHYKFKGWILRSREVASEQEIRQIENGINNEIL